MTSPEMMVHAQGGRAAGTQLITCPDCSAALVDSTRPFSQVYKAEHTESPVRFCVYCYYCGIRLLAPPDRPAPGRSWCTEHGDTPCPPARPEQTIQAGRVARLLARLGLELTEPGWAALGEEIAYCGPGGVPVPGVIVQLCGSPDYVRETR